MGNECTVCSSPARALIEAAPTARDRQRQFTIEEFGMDRYPSLQAAQDGAMPVLAEVLANVIRSGLDSGRYLVQNGVVKLSEEEGACERLSVARRRPRVGLLP